MRNALRIVRLFQSQAGERHFEDHLIYFGHPRIEGLWRKKLDDCFQIERRPDTPVCGGEFCAQSAMPQRKQFKFKRKDGPLPVGSVLQEEFTQSSHAFFRRPAGLQSFLKFAQPSGRLMLQQGQEKLLFGGEIGVESAAGVAGFSGDIFQPGSLESIARKHPQASVQQFAPGFFSSSLVLVLNFGWHSTTQLYTRTYEMWYTYVCIHPMRHSIGKAIILLGVSIAASWAQLPSGGGAQSSSRAAQLPLSGNNGQSGSVATQQSASPQGPATINSSIQVGGNFAGSIPGKDLPAGPIRLTLAGAVKFGLSANLGPISANNSTRAARAERIQALSALLPNISANASDTVTQVNLAAYGFQFKVPASLGFSIPSVVGPYNYSQLQGSLTQSIFDPVSRRNWQASKESERASQLSGKDARELVVLAVGGSYLQAVATAARVDSQRAQVANSDAIYRQAQVRKAAGTNARIDVTRSQVELQTEQQRLSSLEADLRKQKIALARLIGLPQDREMEFAEPLAYTETPAPDTNVLVQQALKQRADLQALEAQVSAAERTLSAARAERLPSANVNGNYGVIGPNPSSTHGVFAVTGSINMPIWQGGRVKGDIQQAEATLNQRQAELADERGRVEQDVRTAQIEYEAASGQVRLALSNRSLANETLAQARDRFGAGVATTVEVVQAQQQVASAESDYISGLFSFDLARLALARAAGDAESSMASVLKGGNP